MIAPVFSYRWQLWLFIGTLAFFMAFPFLPKPDWIDRGILYKAFRFTTSYRSNIFYNIINDPGDIDVLFMGSSSMASGVNPLMVRGALRTVKGEDANVYLVYHPQAGFDFDYILLKDILARRKVKLLIWDALRPPKDFQGDYHEFSAYLWDMNLHRSLMNSQSTDKIGIYLYSLYTGTKLLLSPFLSNGAPFQEAPGDYICNKVYYMGACMRQVEEQLKLNYPIPPAFPLEKLLHYRATDEVLRDPYRYRDFDKNLMEEVLQLAKQHHTAVALFVTPITKEPEAIISIQRLKQNHPGWELPIIGATRVDMLRDTDITYGEFYQEDGIHMLYNATNYYTEIILPAILTLYGQAISGGLDKPVPVIEKMRNLSAPIPNDTPPQD